MTQSFAAFIMHRFKMHENFQVIDWHEQSWILAQQLHAAASSELPSYTNEVNVHSYHWLDFSMQNEQNIQP